MTHYLQRDLNNELSDWTKRLSGLCGCARSKLIVKVVFLTMLDHLDFRTPTKSFLKRIATHSYMATKGQMKCVVELQPGLDRDERVSWTSHLKAFMELVFLE
jgi:hypothetical protein